MGDTTTTMDLSDDQIEQLLKEAEVRLQAKSQGQDNKAVAIPSKPDAETKQVLKSIDFARANPQPELSLRVPQLKRPKQQMVCCKSHKIYLSLSSTMSFHDEVYIPYY